MQRNLRTEPESTKAYKTAMAIAWRARILVLLPFALGRLAAFAEPTEYQVKAAYIYNFVKFTEWPKGEPFTHLTICVYGKDPFGGALEEAVHGKLVRSLSLSVAQFAADEPVGDRCQVIFFGSMSSSQLESGLKRAQGHSVITIGESESFIEKGGMIGLVMERGRVRFDVNLPAIEAAHLELSSHVAALGRRVKVSPPGKGANGYSESRK